MGKKLDYETVKAKYDALGAEQVGPNKELQRLLTSLGRLSKPVWKKMVSDGLKRLNDLHPDFAWEEMDTFCGASLFGKRGNLSITFYSYDRVNMAIGYNGWVSGPVNVRGKNDCGNNCGAGTLLETHGTCSSFEDGIAKVEEKGSKAYGDLQNALGRDT